MERGIKCLITPVIDSSFSNSMCTAMHLLGSACTLDAVVSGCSATSGVIDVDRVVTLCKLLEVKMYLYIRICYILVWVFPWLSWPDPLLCLLGFCGFVLGVYFPFFLPASPLFFLFVFVWFYLSFRSEDIIRAVGCGSVDLGVQKVRGFVLSFWVNGEQRRAEGKH